MDPRPSSSDSPEARLGELPRLLKPLTNTKRLSALLFLRESRFMEEIATHLRVTRQAATRHVQALAAIGLVTRRAAADGSAALVEYVLAPEALHVVHEFFEDLVVQFFPGGDSSMTRLPGPRRFNHSAKTTSGPVLSVVHGVELGRTYPLSGGRRAAWTIGRGASSEIRIPHDSFVSARHAEVRQSASGVFTVVDAFSRNGTWVNWQPVVAGTPVSLEHGDIVGVGRTILLLAGLGSSRRT